MIRLMRLKQLLDDERGATAIEYALICGIMGVALLAVAGVGGALTTIYDQIAQIIPALGGASTNSGG